MTQTRRKPWTIRGLSISLSLCLSFAHSAAAQTLIAESCEQSKLAESTITQQPESKHIEVSEVSNDTSINPASVTKTSTEANQEASQTLAEAPTEPIVVSADPITPDLSNQTKENPLRLAAIDSQDMQTSPVLRGLEPSNNFKLGATYNEYESLSTMAARKELELLNLNARYRVESTKTDRYKPWRTAAFNLGMYTFSNIGIDHVAYARWRTWQRPATAGKPFLEFGPSFLIAGHSIGTVGVLTEVTIDMLRARQLKKMGFDETSYRKKVATLKTEIDSLLTKRESALASTSFEEDAERQLAQKETLLLKNVRDGALNEYKNFCVRGKSFRIARNVGNLMAFGGTTTGGYMGALCGLLAISNRKPHIAGPAGIGFILSGTFIVLGPIVSKASAVISGNHLKTRISRELGTLNVNAAKDLDVGRKEITALCQNNSNSANRPSQLLRNRLYELGAQSLIKDTVMADAEKQAAKKEFKEKVIANAIIGGTKIGWGAQLANAGFGFHKHATKPTEVTSIVVNGKKLPIYSYKPKASTSLFSRRVAQGATTFIPGTAVGIIDTLQSRLRGEVRTRKLKSEGKLPAMVIGERLKKFDQLDKQLEAEVSRLQQHN
ncbi:MAG: hypothetical protein IPP57_02930 [Candidatus Obscuribacter sp.]|nr:hypothetical protein [Candidatus Obscuribacter sp.]MDQ5965311.1 hypothetical protein [Cyanobacteriota bacterium erpe_2018_sw_39hr_WHONDRS-SW48-000098_B_bin.30]MBK9618813.1 hypothetical protein [Candidatus Obscuribacter sp.]MBK9769777.1 hypothetical protein [Candidatus Obscuribacter sp.]MBL0184325.1 hypothetical protein [Candidatus Obscuribacter sp.]